MVIALGLTVGAAGFAGNASARWGDHDYHDNDNYRYRPPPVVYYNPAPRYYYPPPVVYGPGVGVYTPGLSINIH